MIFDSAFNRLKGIIKLCSISIYALWTNDYAKKNQQNIAKKANLWIGTAKTCLKYSAAAL